MNKKSPSNHKKTNKKLNEILKTSVNLFYKKGFSGTSLNDIAEKIGIQKPTIYHYIKSKNELLFIILNNFLDLLLLSHIEATKEIEDKFEKLIKIIINQIKTHAKLRKETAIFVREVDLLPKKYKTKIREKEEKYLTVVADDIRKIFGDKKGLFLDPKIIPLTILSYANTVNRLFSFKFLQKEEILRIISETLVNGILPQKEMEMKGYGNK